MKPISEITRHADPPQTAREAEGDVTCGMAPGFRTCRGQCPHPGRSLLCESIASTPEDVRCGLKRITERLAQRGIASADLDAVELVLAECLNNVVEHAHDRCPGGNLELRLCLSANTLFCRIEDGGEPMPGLTLPEGRPRDLDVEVRDLPEGGFGWFLIRSLTNGLRYARRDCRNSLSFFIPLGRSD